MLKNKVIKGTCILTLAGLITRIIGFYYRIFLSKTIGAEGIGLYQMIFPIYGLCFALSVSGIQTAISKYVAADNAKSNRGGMMDTLKTGLFMSLTMSIITAFTLYHTSEFIAIDVLGDIRCKRLLELAAFSVPLGAMHSCICSYYIGRQKTLIPGFSQLIEQIIRVFSVYIITTVLISSNAFNERTTLMPELAVIGLILGEAASCTLSLLAILSDKEFKLFKKIHGVKKIQSNLINMAGPLTLNRVIISVVTSLEAILIPLSLQKYGLEAGNAIATYGILTGMAMPFIFLPSTLTNSISALLLPSISESLANDNTKNICFISEKSIKYCLSIGIFCTGFFVVFGNELGVFLYDNYIAGAYICILGWLCPFLYLCSTLSSILNGLGCTKATFRNNMLSTISRIAFIIIIVPKIGIKGYLYGLLFSEILCALLHILSLTKKYRLHYDFSNFIMKPVLAELLSLGVSIFTYNVVTNKLAFGNITNLIIAGGTGGLLYLFYLAGDVKDTISQ
ncbi:MAG: polysaccharide biosynthesis protein [Lachnospiraceae bacterium]|nr:polysaccharide biosynthesis protein [Lachnospiraceae bacterium]